jgi:RNA polymerase sigma-70 factor (ECF subfamily)
MSEGEDRSGRQTRPSLLVRVRDPADAAAWDAFVAVYAPMVYRYARRRGLQDADAADLTQEVLAEVARCIRSFEYRPEVGRFRDWLGTLTRRKLGRQLGRKARQGVEHLVDLDSEHPGCAAASQPDPEWDVAFAQGVWNAAIEQSRGRFEPLTWRAFERVWVDGLSAAETAAELGLPIEKVYVAKSRVLKRLEEQVRLLAEDAPLTAS